MVTIMNNYPLSQTALGQMWWLMPITPVTQEMESWKIVVHGQPQQKVSEKPSQQLSWAWWWEPVIPFVTGHSRRISLRTAPNKNKSWGCDSLLGVRP
jgi:hypothetical protein